MAAGSRDWHMAATANRLLYVFHLVVSYKKQVITKVFSVSPLQSMYVRTYNTILFSFTALVGGD